MAKTYIEWDVEELEERREEIAQEQAALQAEHRHLGALLNLKNIDLDAVKAEHARLGSVIKASEMAMEVDNG